jgi:DHA1 family inner membrane transport protein
VEARYRGGFMSINSAVQQLSMGVSSLGTGLILGQNEKGEMTHYPINGILSLFCVCSCIYLARFLRPAPQGEIAVEPAFAES